jgi:hypothetical protein
MTGDESIDRHRRDWWLGRLSAWADLAYQTCVTVRVVEVRGR